MTGEEPMREEEIRAAHVGEAPRLDGPVRLDAYDPGWPAAYARQAGRIRAALGDAVLRLEHVGSTAVPGLPAKPVLDVVLAVRDPAEEAAYVPALEAAGYRLAIREPGWYEHRLLRHADPAQNLHVFPAGCAEIDRMLRFRDRLRADAADRALYARTKRELARRTWAYMQNYADAKARVVAEILARSER